MKYEKECVHRKVSLFFSPRVLIVALMVVFVAVPPSAWGQQVTAAILGRVSDPNGDPVISAKVTAQDMARGTEWTTVTNSEGAYNLPRLPVGTYRIRVEAQGFKTAVHPEIQLELNQTARVDLKMELGAITETIEVTSGAPLLQTDTTQLGTVIDSKTNQTLPLATRNYIQLTLLAPGSVHPNPQTLTNGLTTATGGRPYINGNREQANNFLLDGLDNNHVSDNLVGYTPAPDAIQEFNLITNNAPAEFGNFQGGIVSVNIKSGTNEYHGNAFEFFRNDVLNANFWHNNFTGTPRPKIRWNMFGGTFGGPIIKDKLFFFGDYQAERFNTPSATGAITVFTLAERQGDFSALCSSFDANGLCRPGQGVQLYNPFQIENGRRVPFIRNQIPQTLMDPVARALFSSPHYPAPINNNLQNNQLNTSGTKIVGDQGDIKIDYNASTNDHIFGRYSQSQLDNPTSNSFPLIFGTFFEAPTYNSVVNWTRMFNPGLVNEARFGVNYVRLHNGGTDNGLGNIAQDLGIQRGNERGPGLFAINFGAAFVTGLGSANIGTQQLFPSTVIQFEDSLILTKGSHILRTGFQYQRQRINPFYAGNFGRTGEMFFNGKFTAGPDPLSVAGGGAGAGEADFFLGLPTEIRRGVNTGSWGQRAHVVGAYFQDDWRATDTLTLNVGLRYETHTPWVEVRNRQTNFAPFSGAIQLAGTDTIYGNDRALYDPHNWDFGNFQPRFGFAWTPAALDRKAVIRGAYTVSSYLEGTGTNLRLTLNPPFNTEFDTRYDSLTLPASRTAQGFTVLSSPTDPFAGATIRLWDPDVRPAVVQQWNLSMQYELLKELTLQLGYVGQHGTHLMTPMPYLQRRLLGRNPNGSINTAPSPYLSGNPSLQNRIGQISGTESNSSMRYDALQAVVQKRFSSGLQFQVAYTYSKVLTNSSGYYGSWGGQTVPTSPYWQNLYDMRSEWGPAYYDVTHSLSSYAVYELPVGRGKKFGNNMHKVANAVVGNWQLSGILTLRGGFPLTIAGGDASGTNSRGARANCLRPAEVFGRRNHPQGGFQWFDPAAFGPAAPGTFGTCGIGTVRGPGLHTFDLSLQKRFHLSESKWFEFRSEFINFTNTPILNIGYGTQALGGDLGHINNSQGARNIQFALKFFF
jgi:hypothetical protein